MSVRAYRVIRIQTEDTSSFNLWSDNSLVSFLEAEAGIFEHLSTDGTGMTEIPVSAIKKAVKKSAELNLNEATVAQLKKDIALARAEKEEFLCYLCV